MKSTGNPGNTENTGKKTVVVGMSGGVDSSVAALLLKEQGFNVIGLFMRNWEEKETPGNDSPCQATLDFQDVVRVCETLDIPYYSIDLAKDYWDRVFTHFLRDFEAGTTPNPDILCNREIKFQVFFDVAMTMGADFLATGHYARIGRSGSEGPNGLGQECTLMKGKDPQKDQSYFLYTLKSKILEKVLFPVGDLPKEEVRRLARTHHLATHGKKDSTGICFIGERPFAQFLGQFISSTPGPFKQLTGEVVGEHQGVSFYTLGQRKGLGLGGPGEAWYVVGKNVAENIVYVERGATHPSLYVDRLTANELTWVGGNPPPVLPFSCKAKVRYRQSDQDCLIERIEEDRMWVSFPIPQRAVTPRQSIVFYRDDQCLGGAMIESHGPTYFEQGIPLPQVLSP